MDTKTMTMIVQAGWQLGILGILKTLKMMKESMVKMPAKTTRQQFIKIKKLLSLQAKWKAQKDYHMKIFASLCGADSTYF